MAPNTQTGCFKLSQRKRDAFRRKRPGHSGRHPATEIQGSVVVTEKRFERLALSVESAAVVCRQTRLESMRSLVS
jgi:hypothetical protein